MASPYFCIFASVAFLGAQGGHHPLPACTLRSRGGSGGCGIVPRSVAPSIRTARATTPNMTREVRDMGTPFECYKGRYHTLKQNGNEMVFMKSMGRPGSGQEGLGACVSLFRGLAPPFHRFGVVLGNTAPFGVHVPELSLSVGVSLFCRFAIPVDRL